jgi:hypothetical protein
MTGGMHTFEIAELENLIRSHMTSSAGGRPALSALAYRIEVVPEIRPRYAPFVPVFLFNLFMCKRKLRCGYIPL